jgi:hypothetical protein
MDRDVRGPIRLSRIDEGFRIWRLFPVTSWNLVGLVIALPLLIWIGKYVVVTLDLIALAVGLGWLKTVWRNPDARPWWNRNRDLDG